MEIRNGLVFIFKPQFMQRIHKKRCPAAHFIAQHGNPCARMVKRFHDDVFQFFAQELFNRRFVLFFHFRVIRQHADGPELFTATALVCSKKFLHRLGGVRPVV